MKYILTIILSLAIVLPGYASEVTGTVTTGVDTGVQGTVLEKPIATPDSGVFTSTQNIVLSGAAGTLSIHYTTDGSTPSTSSSKINVVNSVGQGTFQFSSGTP